jgi:3-oxoacyl-[acyl-carrier-protein] synthase III
MRSKIIGTGYFVPQTIVTNKELEKLAPTNAEWIEKNTGIKERHISDQGETASYLGGFAVMEAIISAKIRAEDVDMLIVATATPDKLSPSTACIIKDDLKLTNAVAFDVSAVCSGFLFGLSIADKYITSGEYKKIVVVGVDVFSTITDWKNRDCVFFGDGAGAVVLAPSNIRGFCNFSLYSDSIDRVGFYCDHGRNFTMDTHHVYNTAVRVLPIAINGVLEKSGLTIEDIDYLIPHQPSKRILLDVADKIKLPHNKVMMNMDRYGNTVAATIPILLHETWDRFEEGDIILFAAIGSGWTYGAAIYEV